MHENRNGSWDASSWPCEPLDGALDASDAGAGALGVSLACANGDAVSSDASDDDGAYDGECVACASNGADDAYGACDGRDAVYGAYGGRGDAHAYDVYDAGVSCDALPYISDRLHLPYNQLHEHQGSRRSPLEVLSDLHSNRPVSCLHFLPVASSCSAKPCRAVAHAFVTA